MAMDATPIVAPATGRPCRVLKEEPDMHALTAVLVPVIVVVVVGLIIWYVAERFSPDPLITKIVKIVIFAVVLIVLLLKLLPLLGI
jgi:uncharacterized membrane protein